jgi:hypothetical protein
MTEKFSLSLSLSIYIYIYIYIYIFFYLVKKISSGSYVWDVNTRKISIEAGQEETTVEATLEELAQEIHSSVGVRMHRLGVFVWEVKLWVTACGQANGAWRVIVNNVTGHTSTVHVSFYLLKSFKERFLHVATFIFYISGDYL